MENTDVSSGEPFMKEEDLYKCYSYLSDIDPETEIDSVYNQDGDDLGSYVLYGVQVSEDGEEKLILINDFGVFNSTNPDKYAKKIATIFDENNY